MPDRAPSEPPRAGPTERAALRVGRRRRRLRPRQRATVANWLGLHVEQLLLVLVAVTVGGSVLAAGTVHGCVLLAVAPVAISSGMLAIWMQRLRLRSIPAPALGIAALAIYSGLQAAPLPMRWLGAIAPSNADAWARSLHGFGEAGPAWASVSIDPGASLVEALKWLCYAAVFVAGATLGRRRDARTLVGIVFGSGLATALVALAHGVVGARLLYGIYEPAFARPHWALAPLLNPNNLAGYLNLAAFCGVGLLAAARPVLPRWLLGLGVATLVGMTVISASRGGVLALVVGAVAVCFALTLARRSRRWTQRRRGTGRELRLKARAWPPLAATLAGGIVLAVLGANDAVWNGLREEGFEKLSLLAWTKELVADHLWLGVGRGAFEPALAPFVQGGEHVLFAYAENFVAQWIAEWGLPVGAATLLALGYALSICYVRLKADAVAAAACVGLAVLLLQNLADLGLEIASVGIAATAILGGLWGQSAQIRTRREAVSAVTAAAGAGSSTADQATPARRLVAVILLASLGAAAVTLAAARGLSTALEDRQRLSKLYTNTDFADPAAGSVFRSELHAALRRHPADPHLPLLGALAARGTRDQSPLGWLTQALERAPSSGRPHFILAELLARAGAREQALLELRLATERSPELQWLCASVAVTLANSLELLRRAVPEGPAGASMLTELAVRVDRVKQAKLRSQLLQLALEREPHQLRAHETIASDLIAELPSSAPGQRCHDRAACLRRIEQHLRAVREAAPDQPTAIILRARLLLAQKRPAEAERLLADNCGRYAGLPGCWHERVIAADQMTPADRLDEAMSAYLASACSRPADCAGAADWLGDIRAQRGDWAAAATKYERAAREEPTPERWLKLADAATRAGQLGRASQALRRARQGGAKADPKLERRLEEAIEQQLLRNLDRGRQK